MQQHVGKLRFPLLALGGLALLSAVWGGLGRLGWGLPGGSAWLSGIHGPIMVGGFLGTLIGVERAVALGSAWSYAPPLCTGLGTLALLMGLPGSPLMTLGSFALVMVFVVLVGRQPGLATVTMTLGAVVWFVGNVIWFLGSPLPYVVPWWSGFLILTITGERLELSRLLRLSRAHYGLVLGAMLLLLAGLGLTTVHVDRGVRLYGVGMLVLAWWLLRYDIARRTVRQKGLTRYIALCLLSGYGWLAVSGVLSWRFGGVIAGFSYDAMLHSVFVGFVFAMIFGHALIIFPAVVGSPIRFHPGFYAPLGLLHLSLLLRVMGDLLAWLPGRQWGGLLNALSIGYFFGLVAFTILRCRRSGAAHRP